MERTPYREWRISADDGLSLYLRDYGDAAARRAPVLCLPGLTRNSADFEELAPRLARDRRVLCPDYRGRGRSDYDPDWRNYAPGRYLADSLDLLTATNAHGVVVIGTSLGGILAMMLAVARPTALAGVVLNDIGPEIDPRGIARIGAYLGTHDAQPDWAAATAFVREAYPNRRITDDADWLRIARRSYRELADGRLHPDFDPAIARAFRAGRGEPPDLWPAFRALRRLPVLVVRGALSDILSAETVERMAAEKPDLLRLELAGVGHVPLLEEPECLDAIDDLLARL